MVAYGYAGAAGHQINAVSGLSDEQYMVAAGEFASWIVASGASYGVTRLMAGSTAGSVAAWPPTWSPAATVQALTADRPVIGVEVAQRPIAYGTATGVQIAAGPNVP